MSKRIKIFAIIAVALALIMLGSSLLSKKGSTSTTNTKNPNSPLSSSTGSIPLPSSGPSQQNADEFSNLLSTIKRISIDTSIFENVAYKMLRDFPVSLGSDIVGRVNPFAPIGTDLGGEPDQEIFLDTIQAGKVTATTAEFGAQLSLADSTPTTIIFEYGMSDNFGNATAPVNVTKSGTTLVTVTKLVPETTYYVRAVAVRGSLTTTGNITSFTTTKK